MDTSPSDVEDIDKLLLDLMHLDFSDPRWGYKLEANA
jgi:hypothetical protein